MVALDYQLLRDANSWISVANAHSVKEMIVAYKQAVTLHNDGWRGHEVYREACEGQLRHFVFEQRMIDIRQRSVAVLHRASVLLHRSQQLHEQSDQLDHRVNVLLGR